MLRWVHELGRGRRSEDAAVLPLLGGLVLEGRQFVAVKRGRRSRELGLVLGIQVRCCLSVFVGYL